MKYNKEDTIKDLEYCIEEFKRKGLFILAEAKEKELKKIKNKGEWLMQKLIDLILYFIICGGYITIILTSMLLIQGLVYQLSFHKINIYKTLLKYLNNLI